MKSFICVLFFIISIASKFFADEKVEHNTASKTNICLDWDSVDGISRMQTSHANTNFWKILRFYEAQIHLNYCGIASAVIILNALSVKAPPSNVLEGARIFTQEGFFTEDISALISKDDVKQRGISLDELAKVLSIFPITIKKFEAVYLKHHDIRSILIAALSDPNQAVLALYHRYQVDQIGEGHWSPISAYDSLSDSFLVMDVARYRYSPVWIDAATFMNAMQTSESSTISRGFIVLEK